MFVMKSLNSLASLSLLVILLSSCAKETSNSDCGILIPYSEGYQDTVADQMEILGEANLYPELRGMINDYGKTRDSIRACIKHTGG